MSTTMTEVFWRIWNFQSENIPMRYASGLTIYWRWNSSVIKMHQQKTSVNGCSLLASINPRLSGTSSSQVPPGLMQVGVLSTPPRASF